MARLSALLIYGTLMIGAASSEGYYGKSLGKLSEFHHGVSGHVYAVDGRTLFIKDFTYDGEGPAAYFYVGNTKSPSNSGAWRLRDERSSSGVLSRYRKKDITLSLPEGKTFQNIKWFSVWCDEFSVNFGDVKIPRNFEYPKPLKIGSLSGVHGVSSDAIVIVDAQTLLIPNFSYDGEAPDAKFWVGVGDKPTSQGYRIPDENGKEVPLRRYDRKTIVLTLPSDLTVFDIGHFGVWCEAFTVDFGHVKITGVNNVPPSLKMLGVSPQNRNQALVTDSSSQKHQIHNARGSNKYQEEVTLRPTTYRPPIKFRLGAQLVQPDERNPLNVNDANFQLYDPVLPSQIYRRADNFQPPKTQSLYGNDQQKKDGTVIQQSQELYYKTEQLYPQQYQQTVFQQPSYNQYDPQIVHHQQQYLISHGGPQNYQHPNPQVFQPHGRFDLDLGNRQLQNVPRPFTGFVYNANAYF